MRFSMTAVNANRMFDACKSLIVMDLECIEKMRRMGCSDDCMKEALRIFLNHASNLYVCGLIDEKFFRFILDGIMDDDAIEGMITKVNDIRKDVVCFEDGQKI